VRRFPERCCGNTRRLRLRAAAVQRAVHVLSLEHDINTASFNRSDRATRYRTAPSRRRRSASAKRKQVRIGQLERKIRRIHPPPSIEGNTRSRNSALRSKVHAGSRVTAVASMPDRLRSGAAQCRSLAQISFCELTSLLSRYFRGLLRDRVLSLSLGGCLNPASSATRQASLRLAYFSLRQIVISSALGMNVLQSLKASRVHAKRCSGVPCEE